MPADFLRVGALGRHFVHHLALVHDHDAVGQFEDLVQILGDQQHRRSGIPCSHDPGSGFRDRFDVQAKARVGDDQQADIAIEFTRQDTTLHIAPGQNADRCLGGGGANAISRDHVLGPFRHASTIQPASAGLPGSQVEAAQVEVVHDRHRRHAAVAQRFLGQHPHVVRLGLLAAGIIRCAVHRDRPGQCRALAAQNLHQILLPIA